MTIERPESLFLILLAPVLVYILSRAYRLGREELRHLSGDWRWHRYQKVYFLKSFLQGILVLAALVFLVLGLSDIHWGTTAVEETEEGMDVALAVDVSRSMLVADSSPDRLARSAEWIMSIMANFPDSHFSLVVFKGRALTLVPLTGDREVIQNLLPSLGPGYLTSTGTSLEAGLSEAFRSLDFPGNRHKALIVFSDGEGTTGNPAPVAQNLRSERMATFVVGMGTETGDTIPQGSDLVVRDDRGRPVISRRNSGVLRTTWGRWKAPMDPGESVWKRCRGIVCLCSWPCCSWLPAAL